MEYFINVRVIGLFSKYEHNPEIEGYFSKNLGIIFGDLRAYRDYGPVFPPIQTLKNLGVDTQYIEFAIKNERVIGPNFYFSH